jgi:hypothetical protein
MGNVGQFRRRAVDIFFKPAGLAAYDILTLSRFQFGATIGFHYIYPPVSIGLSVMLVIACIGVLVMIAYIVRICCVFRGKVKLDRMGY